MQYIFIKKNNYWILFVIFFFLSLFIFISNNNYQKETILNSSNYYIGYIYLYSNYFREYLILKKNNNFLIKENNDLKNYISNNIYNNDYFNIQLHDFDNYRYKYIYAKVINNSVSLLNNYLTLNRGKKDGICSGMGVIYNNSVVGIIKDTSNNFSTVYSILNCNIKISVKLKNNNAIGSLSWNGIDIQYANLDDIPIHIKIKNGDIVLTTGYSLFEENIPIGFIDDDFKFNKNSDFWQLKVKLFTQFINLQYVYIVYDKFQIEKLNLEKLHYDT
ncbi:MAG: rod shape-determining protein MreC [Bacteroides sp.]|nr:MAG: rod shape-determining protein MreC [Bacteroides sp.]